MATSFETFKTQLAADKKKATILGVLLLVLLAAVGRLFLGDGKAAPAAAVAVAVKATPAAAPAIDPSLIRPTAEPVGGASAAASASAHALTPASGLVRPKMMSSKRVLVDGMPKQPTRDLFQTQVWNKFPKPQVATAAAGGDEKQPKGPSFFESLRKQIGEYRAIQQQESARFETELVGLELQSTMTGQTKSAYISGRLVHEGDQIDGFIVLRIRDREVCLGRNGAIGKIRMR